MPPAAPAVTLVVGDEEFLVARTVDRAIAAQRAEVGPELEVVDVSGAEVEAAALAELVSPSLFASRRLVVVRGLHDVSKEAGAALTTYAAEPADEVTLLLTHPGGAKGKALLEALKGAGAQVVECPKVRWPEEKEQFVVAQVREAGGSISRRAAAELVSVVGGDLRELANACAQLVFDSGGSVDEGVIARYHRGRAEATGFVVADRAVEGDTAGALETLRWGLSVGLAPVLVTSSLAANLRVVASVASAGRGSPQQLAGRLGLPVWKVRKAQSWSRGWRPEGIAAAVTAVAAADAAVKGAATDPGYALEQVVLAVTAARNG